MNVNIYETQRKPTQKEIATYLGITRQHLGKIINGECRPSANLAQKIINMDPTGSLTYEVIFNEKFRGPRTTKQSAMIVNPSRKQSTHYNKDISQSEPQPHPAAHNTVTALSMENQ